jgi:hypothetical protein
MTDLDAERRIHRLEAELRAAANGLSALATSLRDARENALEEAAKVVDEFPRASFTDWISPRRCAATIRALKDKAA